MWPARTDSAAIARKEPTACSAVCSQAATIHTSMGDAGVATPTPHSFEMVLMYNYTNASDASAGIYGGITNDASCTFNYYINKYMIARLRYSYTTVRDRYINNMLDRRHVNIIEARVQIKF